MKIKIVLGREVKKALESSGCDVQSVHAIWTDESKYNILKASVFLTSLGGKWNTEN